MYLSEESLTFIGLFILALVGYIVYLKKQEKQLNELCRHSSYTYDATLCMLSMLMHQNKLNDGLNININSFVEDTLNNHPAFKNSYHYWKDQGMFSEVTIKNNLRYFEDPVRQVASYDPSLESPLDVYSGGKYQSK